MLDDISEPNIRFSAPGDSTYVAYNSFLASLIESKVDILGIEATAKPQDILNLQFTSGSTGLPKAAALTHRGMLNSARYIGRQMGVDRHDKILIPVPLFHAFGLIMGMCLYSFESSDPLLFAANVPVIY